MLNLIGLIVFVMQATLHISSPSFSENGPIPSKYTCEGDNVSPALHIENIPSGTKVFAIILNDPDAPMKGGFTHWIAWDIDPVADIGEHFTGAVQGMNGANKNGYMGPCPPTGIHHYHFMLFALDQKLNLDPKSNQELLEKAMQGHIIGKTELIGLYKKMK